MACATVHLRETADSVARHVTPLLHEKQVVVTGGFVGSGPDGATTTLGRGGSDVTAAALGVCLGASEVQIWTDVNGVLTADPRVVPKAQTVPHLSFDDARDLAMLRRQGAASWHARRRGAGAGAGPRPELAASGGSGHARQRRGASARTPIALACRRALHAVTGDATLRSRERAPRRRRHARGAAGAAASPRRGDGRPYPCRVRRRDERGGFRRGTPGRRRRRSRS